jgi:hypothetical protein
MKNSAASHSIKVSLSYGRTANLTPPRRGDYSTELSVTIRGGGEKPRKSSYSSEDWIEGLDMKDIAEIDKAARRYEGGFQEK